MPNVSVASSGDALPMEAFAAHAASRAAASCGGHCMRVCRHMMLHKARAKLATIPVAHTHTETYRQRERRRDAVACGCYLVDQLLDLSL